MGWWGVNVMEGDPPMDAEAEILDALESLIDESSGISLDYTPNDDDAAYDDRITALTTFLGQDGVASRVFGILDQYASELNIAQQVLGEIIICNGLPMPDDVRQAAIQASKDDEWASYADDRKEAMAVYAKRIAEYNGTAVEPVSQGLFGRIAEVLGERQAG
jgi:hypothetical protein